MIRPFWSDTNWISRAALVCAAGAGLAHLGSFFGLAMRGDFVWIVGFHLAVMLLGFLLFFRIGYHHVLAVRHLSVRPAGSRVLKSLIWCSGGAFVFFTVVFFSAFAYGEGHPEVREGLEVWVRDYEAVRVLEPGSVRAFEARELRVFSAGWVFFSLVIALAAHAVERRIKQYQHAVSMSCRPTRA